MNNNIISEIECQEISQILSVLTERKKQQEYFAPKLISALAETSFSSHEKLKRVLNCGSYVCIKPNGKISGANFCRNKLCPLCAWRLSRKTFGKIAKMQSMIEEENPNLKYIFVTLTIPNVKHLQDGIEQIIKAFYNFSNDRQFKKIHNGFQRSLEVTYNEKRGTWHPHIHMVVACKQEYFKELYLKKATWILLWKRALRADYTPIVDVRKVTGERERAIAEIAKYAVKPFDLKTSEADEVELYNELLRATYHRRLRSFSGVYRKMAKRVGLSENMELTDEQQLEISDHEYIWKNGKFTRRILNIRNGQVMQNV